MDYFKILNLKKEPFSNSPEPEFFFQVPEHVACLQMQELAIRLRRGLNVVIGNVGTGKTTLARQLILKFANSDEDKQNVETHLILDPNFSNSLEFLSTVALTFGVSDSDKITSEWQIKENIKNYLFKKGVDEGKIVVLIIDEGQKLPDFCLEVLREFLNYETNQYKLLQIIIFAQNEFEQFLKLHANFADRINQFYFLKPLNFGETRAMIKFRLSKASETDSGPPLFTFPGLWALYKATEGYPRKIISLCHQVMLTLIIQNRAKAGYFLVWSCSERVYSNKRSKLKWGIAATLVFLLALFILLVFGPDSIRVINPWIKKPVMTSLQGNPQLMSQQISPSHEGASGAGSKSKSQVQISYSPNVISTRVQNNAAKKGKLSQIVGGSSVTAGETTIPALGSMKIIGNSITKHYHLPGMWYYDKIEDYCRVEFATEEDALRSGYRKYNEAARQVR